MRLSKLTTIVLLAAAVTAPALAKKDKAKADTPAAPASGASASSAPVDTRPAATVGGVAITMDDVDKAAASQLAKVRQQEFEARASALTGLIQDKLLSAEAAARKVTEEQLLQTEVDQKAGSPTQEEISAFYDKMKSRMGGKSLDDVKPDIERTLKGQKVNDRRNQFLGELSAKNEVKVLLEPPRAQINLRATAPAIGPANAPVTIVEFSDYQCPFCKRAHPTIQQVLSEYKDKVRFVYLDYPLPFHQMALPASEAVHCAEDQGKFWEYHKNLFEGNGDLSHADLAKRAADLGLDAAAFEACTSGNKHDSLIKTNYDDGQALGVTGTPAFFINGRMLVGAQPIEQFRDVINDELTRKGMPAPKPGTGTN